MNSREELPRGTGLVAKTLRVVGVPKQTRRGVAPVLATLLMIAVAVAMSVIIFMWSQGFLSNTSGATGQQQGQQNQAAQSSISVDTTTFVIAAASAGADTATIPKITVFVRNVGAVAVKLGTIQISGISANAGFRGSLTYSWTTTASDAVTETSGTWTMGSGTDVLSEVTLAKGALATIELTESGLSLATTADTHLKSGDVINIKVTTDVGTFATAQFTVP